MRLGEERSLEVWVEEDSFELLTLSWPTPTSPEEQWDRLFALLEALQAEQLTLGPLSGRARAYLLEEGDDPGRWRDRLVKEWSVLLGSFAEDVSELTRDFHDAVDLAYFADELALARGQGRPKVCWLELTSRPLLHLGADVTSVELAEGREAAGCMRYSTYPAQLDPVSDPDVPTHLRAWRFVRANGDPLQLDLDFESFLPDPHGELDAEALHVTTHLDLWNPERLGGGPNDAFNERNRGLLFAAFERVAAAIGGEVAPGEGRM